MNRPTDCDDCGETHKRTLGFCYANLVSRRVVPWPPQGKSWRDMLRPYVAWILKGLPDGLTIKQKRKVLRDLKPMVADCTSHGYKIWLSEIRVQLDVDVDPTIRGSRRKVHAGTLDLFAEAMVGGDAA